MFKKKKFFIVSLKTVELVEALPSIDDGEVRKAA